jgi:hypothetical protein
MIYLLHLGHNTFVLFAEKPTHIHVFIPGIRQRIAERDTTMARQFRGEWDAFGGWERIET